MSFWKVLGTAAAAVATVVALPIAGPIGTITALGAAVAAGVGAAAGGAAAALDDSEERAEARGRQQAKAEAAAQGKKYEEMMQAALRRANEHQELFDLIIAMEAVGLACAACDGAVTPEEQRYIDEFVVGVAAGALPEYVKQQIAQMAAAPPDVKTAYELARKTNPASQELFDEIILVVSHADSQIHPNESQFMAEWKQMRAAA